MDVFAQVARMFNTTARAEMRGNFGVRLDQQSWQAKQLPSFQHCYLLKTDEF